jgi:heme exporter protein B
VRLIGEVMGRWLNNLILVIGKELLVEARAKEVVALLFCTTLVISALVGAGVSSAVLASDTTRKIFPMLVWVVFLLTVTTACARASESELESRGFEGLLLAGVTGAQLYLSKVLVGGALFFINWVVLIAVMGAALDQELKPIFGQLCLIGLSAALALSALTTLISGIAGTSRMRGVLVPLLTLPLLFPLFFAGVEMTTALALNGELSTGSVWPSVILVSGSVFFLVGINTYELAICD